MMGVLNFAHASFYMLGAYFGYQISQYMGFWVALLIAPLLVGGLGAAVERYGLRRVHQHGHVAELIFTFGLALLIEEAVQFFWGKRQVPFKAPEALDFALFSIAGNAIPAYKVFMIVISIAIFAGLLFLLTRTRIGMIIQAALSYPRTVESLGHNVPLIFMCVFGGGTAHGLCVGLHRVCNHCYRRSRVALGRFVRLIAHWLDHHLRCLIQPRPRRHPNVRRL